MTESEPSALGSDFEVSVKTVDQKKNARRKKKRVCFKLAIESSREIVLEELEFLRYLKKTKRKSIVNYEQTKLEKLDEWLSLIQLKRIWILSQKQMFQRLSIELTNLKAGNTSEYLPNKIGQTFYQLYWWEEIPKKHVKL